MFPGTGAPGTGAPGFQGDGQPGEGEGEGERHGPAPGSHATTEFVCLLTLESFSDFQGARTCRGSPELNVSRVALPLAAGALDSPARQACEQRSPVGEVTHWGERQGGWGEGHTEASERPGKGPQDGALRLRRARWT